MDGNAQWHRTFIPLTRYKGQEECDVRCHRPAGQGNGRWNLSDFQVPQPAGPKSPLEQHLERMQRLNNNRFVPPRPEPHDPSQSKFKALQFNAQSLHEVWIVEKPQQNFAAYATAWEKRHSRLILGPSAGERRSWLQADPIVDMDLTVVGHMVRVSGHQLFVPDLEASISRGIYDYLELGIPVYVGDQLVDGWYYLAPSEVRYMVVTGIDGEVVAVLKQDVVGLEESDFWLLDAVMLATGVAGLGLAMGRRVVKSLARRAATRRGGRAARAFTGRSAQRAERAVREAIHLQPTRRYVPESGMPQAHFDAFRQAAGDENVIAIVRNTNPKSMPLIERGCPGKPMTIKAHTSPRTGIVVAETKDEVSAAWEAGYYVVDKDGVARRTVPGKLRDGKPVVEELELPGTFWQLEPGQVIDPALKKPLVGDYDLMGVVDPRAMGRNIALVAKNGEPVADISSPIVSRFRGRVNGKLDQPRVLHGAQDQFADFRGGVTVFYPDGRTLLLPDEQAVRQFYGSIRRETIKGSYSRPRQPVGAR